MGDYFTRGGEGGGGIVYKGRERLGRKAGFAKNATERENEVGE